MQRFIEFDDKRPFDMVLLGRATIDLNPEDMYKPLADNISFRKYLGGSPANVAVGLARLGKKCGFIGRVSSDQFGDFILSEFQREGVDISRMKRCTEGEKTGLTFTEILSTTESRILMYRLSAADLSLSVGDIDEDYIADAKALFLSGTALAASPSREAALKALLLARKTGTPVIFDIDYREYNWKNRDEMSIYYSIIAEESAVIIGSREEYDLTEKLVCPGMDDRRSAEHWQAAKAKIVVIKHGKEGSTAYTADGKNFTMKPFPAKYVKGFGGGDGYASAFLAGLLDGKDVADCLERGNASASMLIGSHGCAPFMPTEPELTAFIHNVKNEQGNSIAGR